MVQCNLGQASILLRAKIDLQATESHLSLGDLIQSLTDVLPTRSGIIWNIIPMHYGYGDMQKCKVPHS